MGGKASILLVLGFSLIFMVAGRSFNNMATDTTENVSSYFLETKAKHAASAGVNVIVNKLFLNATVQDQTFNWTFDSSSISATLSTLDAYKNIRQLLSVGSYGGVSHTTKIIFKPSLFSKFAYFANTEGTIWWTTGDTVWGPFHTNSDLRVANKPIFYGKVTIGGSQINYNKNAKPQYLGGFQKGINIAIPTNGVTKVSDASAQGVKFTGKDLVYFEFRGDSVRYRYTSTGAWTYKLASTFSPNGVIFFDNAEVRLKGTVKGKYTLAASGTTGNKGKIYLDDDIVYHSNPRTNPSSTDMLGIVAERDVVITDNTANNSSINIQAAIYAQTGSFVAENYSTRPPSGFINLYGGITQNTRGAVGTFSGTTITAGFSKRYRYDTRLLDAYPPAYPGTGSFEVVSWFE